MATSRRIVLVDPLGEILFSGESLSVKAPEPAAEAAPELCPETKRSAESGTYRSVDPRLSVTEAPLASLSDAEEEEPATPKRGFRAA